MQGSVGSALFKTFGGLWLWAGVFKFVHDCFNLAAPFFLRRLLQHIQSQDESQRLTGLLWALGLFVCGMMVAIMITQHFERVYRTMSFVKSALVQFLYHKSLRLSLAAKESLGAGVINNLQSNDAAKIFNIPNFGHVLWSAPFQVRCPSSRPPPVVLLAVAFPASICRER
jgi:ATP-binding cassette, subfamily C (CFTR/MRP), member 1